MRDLIICAVLAFGLGFLFSEAARQQKEVLRQRALEIERLEARLDALNRRAETQDALLHALRHDTVLIESDI